MKVRLSPGVRRREEEFGGLCYVPERDDFFALTTPAYKGIASLTDQFTDVVSGQQENYVRLAELGIVASDNPKILPKAYSGVSLIGSFPELPTVAHPLVVNCFATAYCPLRCIYCHADDLMKATQREAETQDQIRNVVATANLIPAMVAVITGGDPLTRPLRTLELLEGIAEDKALVLDTSGVGDVHTLLSSLLTRKVHVRVSLDSVRANTNARFRPVNTQYARPGSSSFDGAVDTIRACLAAGVPVTVQTVVTTRNDNVQEWRDLRDWLISSGIRNWVIHVAVKGGKAREYEERQAKLERPRPLVPGEDIYSKLWNFVRETIDHELPIDIRCTDTNNTPNSVLLVASNGDLYTEGYARKGKVLLYEAGRGRPDLAQSLMTHVDRFGHARRYLNWNPWFHDRKSIEEICVPFSGAVVEGGERLVETEVKTLVLSMAELERRLNEVGFNASRWTLQRDEYYDTKEGVARQLDHAIRIRVEDNRVLFAYKGARFFSKEGASSRLEVEIPAGPLDAVRESLEGKGLMCTWFFEKRRREYRRPGARLVLAIDEIPELGYFLEIEGPLEEVRSLRERLESCVGPVERRNYQELFSDYKTGQGLRREDIHGAEFSRSETGSIP